MEESSLSCCSSTALSEDSSTEDGSSAKKFSRVNTLEEKRKMRNARKKRKKRCKSVVIRDLRTALDNERKKNEVCRSTIGIYRGMSRTYWERWRWELQKRKEAIVERRVSACHPQKQSTKLQEIDPFMLINIDDSDRSYIGRGSFGLVKAQRYRGILVAVKEFLPRTLMDDVKHEAQILSSLCHPYIPCLLGVCMSQKPFRLVMQFEGIVVDGVPRGLTLLDLLANKSSISVVNCVQEWILLCVQLAEVLSYLHYDASILHNDIKSDNILITKISSVSEFQVILADFGKATQRSEGKRYYLSMTEQAEYTRKYVHLAPEVISGESRQSIYSDIYSFGGILYKLADANKFDSSKHVRTTVVKLAEKCRSVHYFSRPTAKEILKCLQDIS